MGCFDGVIKAPRSVLLAHGGDLVSAATSCNISCSTVQRPCLCSRSFPRAPAPPALSTRTEPRKAEAQNNQISRPGLRHLASRWLPSALYRTAGVGLWPNNQPNTMCSEPLHHLRPVPLIVSGCILMTHNNCFHSVSWTVWKKFLTAHGAKCS